MIKTAKEYRRATQEEIDNGSSEMILVREYGYEFKLNSDVASWKLKAILTQNGLIESVNDALNNLPEPNKTVALLAWNHSPTINSESDVTKFVQQSLQLNEQEVYDIFMTAEALTLDAPKQNRMAFKTKEERIEESDNGVKTIYRTMIIRKKSWLEIFFNWFVGLFKKKK